MTDNTIEDFIARREIQYNSLFTNKSPIWFLLGIDLVWLYVRTKQMEKAQAMAVALLCHPEIHRSPSYIPAPPYADQIKTILDGTLSEWNGTFLRSRLEMFLKTGLILPVPRTGFHDDYYQG